MAVDIKQLFNERFPQALAKHPDEAKAIGATYQMNVTGPTGGEWTIDATASGPSCKPGKLASADCTITLADDDFQTLLENPQANAMQLFFAGKLAIDGNQMLAMKLPKLLGYLS